MHILNLIIILIIVLIIYFVYKICTKNDFYVPPVNNIKECRMDKKIIIVVARYNESLSWTLDYPFNQFKYIIYNKNTNNEDYEKKYVIESETIKNQGKCDHTFLYHIVHNYYNLADITIFVPGCIDELYFKMQKTRLLLEYILKYNRAFFITDYCSSTSLYDDFYYFKVDDYRSMTKSNREINENIGFKKSSIRPYGEWFKQNFNNNSKNISLFGIFSIDKRDIEKIPRKKYFDLMKSLECEECINDELSHYFEKSWEAIFYPLKHTIIIDYSNTIVYLIIKSYNYYNTKKRGDIDLDLSSTPVSAPIAWNLIYFLNYNSTYQLSPLNNNN
mgnify:CR=1 FL=1